MIVGIIPARYASTRFPGKPLIQVLGKSMIQRVYEQAIQSDALDEVVIATDDQRIYQHAQSFGASVVMTQANHPSGTDRCREAVAQLAQSYQYIINIQGDEPFIDPSQIDTLAETLQDHRTQLATLVIPVHSHEVLFDPGEAKVVMNANQEALYFSRMVIPYLKGIPQTEWHLHHQYYRHVGMYAYRRDVLDKISQLPIAVLEQAESLEQLRWLAHGYSIKCAITHFDSHCIDTPEDVDKVLRLMQQG